MDERFILAIDLGTSGPKVALTNAQGCVLGCEFHPTPLHLLPGGGAEQDPEEWWSAIKAATARLHARALAPRDAIEAVAVTAQWAGTVALDEYDRPLQRAIVWMDARGAKYVKELASGPLRVQGYGVGKLMKWIRLTGGAPSLVGKEPLSHILWLRHEHPETYRRARSFLEPKDWLNLRLCGERAATYDSITLHWVTDNRDVRRIDYDDGLLALAGLRREQLPRLRQATDVLGTLRPEAAAELGLPPSAKVVGGTPDVHSAAIGSGAVRDFQTHLYLGTSSWLICHVPFRKTDLFNNMASVPAAIPGRYLLANEQETGAGCLKWLCDSVLCRDDVLYPGPPPEAMNALNVLAQGAPPGSDGVIFTPWLYGERCPIADHSVRGGVANVSLRSDRSHLTRAVLEGVAYNSRWLLAAVERFCRRRLDPIRIIGGGARSELWCQIYADVLERTVEQVEEPVQCNARGAALVAALGLGYVDVDDIPRHVRIARRYEPNPETRETYARGFDAFRRLYRNNRKLYARLNSGERT